MRDGHHVCALGHLGGLLCGRHRTLGGRDWDSAYDRQHDRSGRRAGHGSRLVPADSRDAAHRDHMVDGHLAGRDQLDGEDRLGLPSSLYPRMLGRVRRVDGRRKSLGGGTCRRGGSSRLSG